MKKGKRTFPMLLLVILSTFAISLYRWTFATWPNLKMDELIFHMKVSVEGTSVELVRNGVFSIAVPTFLCLVATGTISYLLWQRKSKWLSVFQKWTSLIASLVLVVVIAATWQRFDLGAYLFSSSSEDFIQTHYVDPAERTIVFPEKRKI